MISTKPKMLASMQITSVLIIAAFDFAAFISNVINKYGEIAHKIKPKDDALYGSLKLRLIRMLCVTLSQPIC